MELGFKAYRRSSLLGAIGAALMIWMTANAIWAQRHKAELEMK